MTPANPHDARYTVTELADLAGVTPRTVRYYLAQGLLPAVGASGPGAKYGDEHLARLRLIKRLQREHQPLAEIRRRLEPLSDDEVVALAEADLPRPPDSALDYIRRVTGTPGTPGTPFGPAPGRGPSVPFLARRMDEPPPASSALLDLPPPTPAPTAPAVPVRDLPTEVSPHPQRSQWERIGLGPDVELHIRRPLSRSTAKRVDRLVEIARDLLEEDRS